MYIFRSRIQAENPKVPMAKLMMLVGAKWREFIAGGHQVHFYFQGSDPFSKI
jgi:hypothetical protein